MDIPTAFKMSCLAHLFKLALKLLMDCPTLKCPKERCCICTSFYKMQHRVLELTCFIIQRLEGVNNLLKSHQSCDGYSFFNYHHATGDFTSGWAMMEIRQLIIAWDQMVRRYLHLRFTFTTRIRSYNSALMRRFH